MENLDKTGFNLIKYNHSDATIGSVWNYYENN